LDEQGEGGWAQQKVYDVSSENGLAWGEKKGDDGRRPNMGE